MDEQIQQDNFMRFTSRISASGEQRDFRREEGRRKVKGCIALS